MSEDSSLLEYCSFIEAWTDFPKAFVVYGALMMEAVSTSEK
jgi:hypothetical protein